MFFSGRGQEQRLRHVRDAGALHAAGAGLAAPPVLHGPAAARPRLRAAPILQETRLV